jgi:hypothetical protein
MSPRRTVLLFSVGRYKGSTDGGTAVFLIACCGSARHGHVREVAVAERRMHTGFTGVARHPGGGVEVLQCLGLEVECTADEGVLAFCSHLGQGRVGSLRVSAF